MLVWGGVERSALYDPATDTWALLSALGAPAVSGFSTVVWAGSRMILWGVADGNLNVGGIYDPATDTWTAMSSAGSPTPRSGDTAVWTGSKMIVWGGYDGWGTGYTNTGGVYDVATDTWTPTGTAGAPEACTAHSAVWTGSKMIVWCGELATGGVFDPATNTWTPLSATGAPTRRTSYTALWTGSRMIVWGGYEPGKGLTNTGGLYDPATDTWASMTTAEAPAPLWGSTAVWAGSKMIVWGGTKDFFDYNTGGVYDPSTDTWTPTNTKGTPDGRSGHSAVWTGSRMIVWGGWEYDTGGVYDPTTDTWSATASGPPFYTEHTAIWTGSKMIVSGGSTWIYDPTTDVWSEANQGGPSRIAGSVVWTGTTMIAWGGHSFDYYSYPYYHNTGAIYDPSTDTWKATRQTGAPPARAYHTAVWTGSKMIVWGGNGLNSGGLYDPVADTWTPTSSLNAPSPRSRHTAVWTGSKMIVWGGNDGTSYEGGPFFNTGGIYDPATDTWTATSTTGAPDGRVGHTAVWTGSRMIVWGGNSIFDAYGTGGIYDPVTNTWESLSTGPAGHQDHTAVWTGSKMIVWGGFNRSSRAGYTAFNTGGIYDPATDAWTATTTAGAPAARGRHTAVWTGSRMITFGGTSPPGELPPTKTGIYDPSARPTVAIDDVTVAEGDEGVGNAAFSVTLSEPSSAPVSVAYHTSDGTAVAGRDYQPSSGTLTFAPGETSHAVVVSVLGNTSVEGDRTFFVRLSDPTEAVLGRVTGRGTIRDDDLRIESFVITPTVSDRPGTAVLEWNAPDALSVAISGVSGTFGASGTTTTSFSQTTTYTLTASGPGGATAVATATVTVLPAPGVALGFPSITTPTGGQVVTVSGVTFAWGPIPGAAKYDLRVFDGYDGRTVFSGSLSGADSTSTLVALPGGLYLFAVRACGSSISDSSCDSFATRDFTVSPSAPAGRPRITFPVDGGVLTSSTHALAWTAVAKADATQPVRYEVLVEDLATGGPALRIAVPEATTTIATLPSSVSYRMRVRACQSGCGPYSDPIAFQVVLSAQPTLAPTITDANVTSDAQGVNRLGVAWTAVSGGDLYRLQVVQPGVGPGGGALTVAARQVSETSVEMPIPAGDARVVVQACTADGCGPASGDVAIRATAQNPLAPHLGAPLAGGLTSGPVVSFSWSMLPGDDGTNTVYRLYVQDLSRQAAALDVRTTRNFYSAYLNAEGARYDALVIANPGTANEATGPAVGFNVQGSSPPAPTLVEPAHNSVIRQGNVQLGWSPVVGATLYEYFVAVRGRGDAAARGVTPGLVVQVPLAAMGGQPTDYSGIARACPAGNTCVPGSDAGWGPWSVDGGPGVTNFSVVP